MLFANLTTVLVFIPNYFLYKMCLLGSMLTYSLVVYRRIFPSVSDESKNTEDLRSQEGISAELDSSQKQSSMTLPELLRSENGLLLCLGALYFFTNENVLKLLPFGVYSLLNLCYFFCTEVFCDYSFAAAFMPLVVYMETPLLVFAAHMDMLLFWVLLKESKIKSHLYAVALHLFIFVLRLETSEASRRALYGWIHYIDLFFSLDGIPVLCRLYWNNVLAIINHLVVLEEKTPIRILSVNIDPPFKENHFKEESSAAKD